MLFSSLALALGFGAANVAAQLSKPALWSNLDFLVSDLHSLPLPSINIHYWNLGDLSKGCYDRVRADGRNPSNYKQYTITYGDCGQGWRFCQENGAPQSIEEIARRFARVPVRTRMWVKEGIHHASGSGAYAVANYVVFSGGSTSTGVMIHEATHCVDGSGGFYSMRSNSQEWVDAYNKDTAVPDNYARTSQAENLAQFPGLIIVDRFTNGALVRNRPEISRIGNQIQKVADQADWNSPYGGRVLDITGSGVSCTRRWQDDPIVFPRTGQVADGTARAPTSELPEEDLSGHRVVTEPEDVVYVKYNCTIV